MKLVSLCWIYVTCFLVLSDAIYNSEYRSVKHYPFMVQINTKLSHRDTHYCGATILSEYWIVSAAHCVGVTPKKLRSKVRVGSSATFKKGKLIYIEKFYVHGDYNPSFGWDSDIALIKLKTAIEFNEYQQPIHLSQETPRIGDNITVVGFGDLHHEISVSTLRAGQIPTIGGQDCLKILEQKYSKDIICASTKNIDLCFGDSGGPAVHDDKLIGVISGGCGIAKVAVFKKMANYYEWILQITGIKYKDQF